MYWEQSWSVTVERNVYYALPKHLEGEELAENHSPIIRDETLSGTAADDVATTPTTPAA